MPPVQVSAALTFLPYLNFFLDIGSPVDRWLEECRLPYQIYEDPAIYIPTLNTWHFISLGETKEGIDDLGLRIGHDHVYEALGLPLMASTLAAPTLLSGIERFTRGVRGISSGTGVVLARGEHDSVNVVLRKSFDFGVSGFSQTEWLGLYCILAVVHLFAGRRWQPEVISLRSTRMVPALAQALFPDVHIMRGQEASYVSFPKQMLSLGPSDFGTEVVAGLKSQSEDLRRAEPPADFADSIQRLMVSYLPDGYLSLEGAAEITGMSPRTLQRRLASVGVEYRWLMDCTRFDVASGMLLETDASSMEIALATGYEDPSHFARAFRRIAGCSPQQFRRRHAGANSDQAPP